MRGAAEEGSKRRIEHHRERVVRVGEREGSECWIGAGPTSVLRIAEIADRETGIGVAGEKPAMRRRDARVRVYLPLRSAATTASGVG
jgi:hypothetical protein